MKRSSQRTHRKADTKAEKPPSPNMGKSAADSSARSLYSEYTVAPNKVGIARKNENSVAARRDRPKAIAPMMVAPERLVPGISAKHCARPTLIASTTLMSSTLSTRETSWRRLRRSTTQITSAPIMKAIATGTGLNRCALIILPNARPSTTAGRKATSTLTTKRRARMSLLKLSITLKMRARYSQHTASIAPAWITISKTLTFSPVKFSRLPARIR